MCIRDSSWEGADKPNEPSIRSTAYGHVNQLRDPAIFEEDGNVYLLYAVAGESGIGLAQVHLDNWSKEGKIDESLFHHGFLRNNAHLDSYRQEVKKETVISFILQNVKRVQSKWAIT